MEMGDGAAVEQQSGFVLERGVPLLAFFAIFGAFIYLIFTAEPEPVNLTTTPVQEIGVSDLSSYEPEFTSRVPATVHVIGIDDLGLLNRTTYETLSVQTDSMYRVHGIETRYRGRDLSAITIVMEPPSGQLLEELRTFDGATTVMTGTPEGAESDVEHIIVRQN